MQASAEKPKVLCVDDEPAILEGFEQHLRKRYEVHTSTSGILGLEKISARGPFAVVISDMRMPQMTGAAFLSRVREVSPDTVRILLTGQTDLESAIAAVNNGQIFRFLTKPCPMYQLQTNLEEAVKQYNLTTVERTLLEKTLRGAVKALTDALALASPLAFGRATRLRQRVSAMCDELGVQERWHIEVAAMLSQLGAITLPDELAAKYYAGKPLDNREQALVDGMGAAGRSLLADIPRLEPVFEILEACDKADAAGNKATCSELATQLLLIARDFDRLECSGMSDKSALDQLSSLRQLYGERALHALARIMQPSGVEEVALSAVEEGMIFADDVLTDRGGLLVARGYEVTQGFLARARTFRAGHIREPLRVIRKRAKG